ncbi:hypothetical protein Tco_1367953 [Tanacetum coccineum]
MVSSHPVFPPLTGCDRLVSEPRMSTPVFIDPKSSTQAYLDRTDTESEPFEDPIDTKTPESPLTIAPTIPLSESNLPVFGSHSPQDRMYGCARSTCDVIGLLWRSPSVSPPDLPSRKRYHGTPELVEDSDDEEEKEIEESMDSDSMSEDAEDEGPTAEDEDHAAEDEGLIAGVEGPGMDDKGYGSDDESRGIDDEGHSVESDGLGLEEEEEAVSGGQHQAAPVVGTTVSAPLGLGYGALRRQSEIPERVSAFRQPTLTTWTDPKEGMIYIDIPDYQPPTPPVQTPPSPEWTSGSLPISPLHSDVPSPISSPMEGLISDHVVRLEELSPALFERYDRDIGELFTRSGAGENQDLRLQLAEERRARLELAEIIDGMRKGQEPRGGA